MSKPNSSHNIVTPINVWHQDPFLIEDTKKVCATLFGQILAWKPEDGEEKLMEMIALFRYVFAYMMPSYRGDGAIGDWAELVFYHFHGFSPKHAENCLPSLEPLACLTPKNYIDDVYKTTIIKLRA